MKNNYNTSTNYLDITPQTMWFRKNTGNRLSNTALAPIRWTLWTWWHTFTDTVQTALYWAFVNPIEWLWKTASSIWDAVHSACTQWKRYKKLWKVPATLATVPFMAIEWVGETLFHTWWNLLRNTRDTIANPFINIWRSIKSLGSSQPVWAFSFASINNRSSVTPRNRLAAQFA